MAEIVLIDDCGVVIVDDDGVVVHDAGEVELCTEFCAPLDPCCPPGSVCSPPGDRFTSTRPTATLAAQMTGSATLHDDGPPASDLSDFEVMTAAASQLLPTTNDWEDCVKAPYSATLYEEITNPSGFDRIKRVTLSVEMRAQGQTDPGLHILMVTEIDLSQDITGTQAHWSYTAQAYISTQAGRAPCVEWIDSMVRSLVPGDFIEAPVPLNIHIDADGPCPTAVTLGWNGTVSGSDSFPGGSLSHAATARGSLTISDIPWTRCNDAATAEVCTGACCKPDGSCEITTQSVCDALGGTFYPSQPCADPSPCAECPISGRLLVFSMAGASGTAGGVTIRGVGATNGAQVWDLGPLLNVLDFEEHRGRLYAGGSFTLGSSGIANAVARWNCDHWEPVGQGLIGEVRRLKSIRLPGLGTVLHAFGSFTGLGAGGSALRVARFNEASGEWEAVLNGLNNVAQGGDFGSISTGSLGSTPAGTGLTVGGFFTSGGGGTPANLRRVAMDEGNDGPAWSEPFTNGADGTVYDILSHVTTNPIASHLLFLGGDFSTINGQSRLRYAVLARAYSGSSWSATPTAGFTNRVNRLVKEGNTLGGTLWACGRFSGVIAYANDALGTSWTTPTAGINLANEALDMVFGADPAGGGDALFFGGTMIDNVTGAQVRLAKVKGGVVSPVLAAAPSAQVFAVQVYDFPGFEHGARPAAPGGISRARGVGGCGGCSSEAGLVGEDDE